MSADFSSKRPLTNHEEAEVQRMIASDPENPELTLDEIKRLKPFREILPDLAASMDREFAKRGRPKAEQTKQPITIRLDPDLVDHYKAKGRGWQSRMNEDLRKLAGI